MKYRSLLLLIGLAVCLSAAACNDAPPAGPATNSAQTPSPRTDNSPTPRASASVPAKVDPEQLIDRIKRLQGKYVRDSTGTEADQCFTDDDFDEFNKQKKTAEIIGELQNDKDFIAIINAVRGMDMAKRSALLDKALSTYRKEWRLLKLNPDTASPAALLEGQSKAGMKAEKLIAQTVVDLVKKMI